MLAAFLKMALFLGGGWWQTRLPAKAGLAWGCDANLFNQDMQRPL
jgi:hypothetical protein